MNIKVPVSWLRDYLKTDLATKTLTNYLSLSGPSVEKIEKRSQDYILEIEVTSNRTDVASIYGLARETHAILTSNNQKSTLVEPKGLNSNLEPDTSKQRSLEIIIKDQNLCPRFSAIVLDNIKIKPSPALIRNRLEASGIRSINNIVDISNYIMLELGQPLHIFDLDKINGAKMILRRSQSGEKIVTIDNVARKLPEGSIVIQDSQKLIDLCGIMGGLNSKVSNRTKRIVIFVQAYDSLTIRKTTQALNFRTEAAARFEKGIDLEGILPALARSVYLAKQLANAKITSELIDIYPQKPRAKTIKLAFIKLNQYLGIKIEPEKVSKILENLGFKTKYDQQYLTAKVPSWRNQDIESDVDLIEEIARIHGYHNLPSKLPQVQATNVEKSDLEKIIELKKTLKVLGLTEIISYSIVSKNLLAITGSKEKDIVELTNPLSEEWQYMRPTIIPSILTFIKNNQNITQNISAFEIARTYIKQTQGLPIQDLKLSIVQTEGDFYKTKGLVETIFEFLKYKPSWYKLSQKHSLFEEYQSAEIKIGNEPVGIMGSVKQDIASYFNLQNPPIAAEINLTKIYKQAPISNTYKPIGKHPPIIEDISLIFPQTTQVGNIISQIEKSSTFVKKVEIIDIFRNEKIGIGKKSITLKLTFQKLSNTPTQEEVTKEREKILNSLQKNFLVKVR